MLKLINWEQGLGVENYIRSKGFLKYMLKFIAMVANRQDILDLKMELLLVNVQAVKRITKGLTFFS